MHVQTFGNFQVWREDEKISSKDWGRDKTIQLFQFLVTARHRHGLHKEQIVDRLWEEASDKNFKVALHGINKTLEPNRKSRTEAKYILRQGVTYQLNGNEMHIKGGKIKGGIIDSHNDHRIAMMGAIASLTASSPISIKNPEAINKSYPTFYNDYTTLTH